MAVKKCTMEVATRVSSLASDLSRDVPGEPLNFFGTCSGQMKHPLPSSPPSSTHGDFVGIGRLRSEVAMSLNVPSAA